MADDLLEPTTSASTSARSRDGEVTVAWQGGEPTLMGVDFFRRAVALAEEVARPGQQLQHTIQTNGTLLTDEWCELLARHRLPRRDQHRRAARPPRPLPGRQAGRSDVGQGPAGPRACSQAHDVDVNVLCTVHAANQDHPLDVYRYFRDDLGHHVHPVHPHRRARERHGVPGGRHGHRPVGRPGGVGRVPRARCSTSGSSATSAPCSSSCSTPRWPAGADLPSSLCIFRGDVRRRRGPRAQR